MNKIEELLKELQNTRINDKERIDKILKELKKYNVY